MKALSKRAEAKAAGATTYFTGLPCKHGHIAKRCTANGSCITCSTERAKAARDANLAGARAKERERRARNPEQAAKRNAAKVLALDALDPGRVERRKAKEVDASRRVAAATAGSVHYESGIACPTGHIGLRYTSTARCVACQLTRNEKTRDLSTEEAQLKAAHWKERKEAASKKAEARAARAAVIQESNRNRDLARARGEMTYQGRPCKRGHDGVRYAVSQECVTCVKETTKKQVARGYYSQHYRENFETISLRNKEYRATLPREHWTEKARAWAKANPERRRAIARSYKARRRSLEESGMTTAELLEWDAEQEKVCHWCGDDCETNYHVDHYFPLSRGGPHCASNLVIACPQCNVRKGARMPDEWIDVLREDIEEKVDSAYMPTHDLWHTESMAQQSRGGTSLH